MEGPVTLLHLQNLVWLVVEDVDELDERFIDPASPTRIGPSQGTSKGQGFQQLAELVYLEHVLGRNGRHPRAPLGNQFHEASTGEALKCLPQWRRADLPLVDQVGYHQLLARSQLPG